MSVPTWISVIGIQVVLFKLLLELARVSCPKCFHGAEFPPSCCDWKILVKARPSLRSNGNAAFVDRIAAKEAY